MTCCVHSAQGTRWVVLGDAAGVGSCIIVLKNAKLRTERGINLDVPLQATSQSVQPSPTYLSPFNLFASEIAIITISKTSTICNTKLTTTSSNLLKSIILILRIRMAR